MIKSKTNPRSIQLRRLIQSAHQSRSSLRNPKVIIKNVITSLEKNVGQLKQYYETQDVKFSKPSLTNSIKHTPQFRSRKSLRKNPSQKKLKTIQDMKNNDRSITDIFEIKSMYARANGKQTNSIIELYEFFKKNVEKRQKSTRIMASMQFSNAQYGSSLQKSEFEVQKENSKANNSKLFSMIADKPTQRMSIDPKAIQPLKSSCVQKPSKLAEQLIKKGCYNYSNVVNLLTNKRYKISKVTSPVQNRQKSAKKNNLELKNIPMQKEDETKKIQQFITKENDANALNIKQIASANFKQISFNESSKNFERIIMDESKCSPIQSSSKKNSIRKERDKSNKKDIHQFNVKTQSPILRSSQGSLKKDRYFVRNEKRQPNFDLQGSSISIKESSRIINLDLIPFDL